MRIRVVFSCFLISSSFICPGQAETGPTAPAPSLWSSVSSYFWSTTKPDTSKPAETDPSAKNSSISEASGGATTSEPKISTPPADTETKEIVSNVEPEPLHKAKPNTTLLSDKTCTTPDAKAEPSSWGVWGYISKMLPSRSTPVQQSCDSIADKAPDKEIVSNVDPEPAHQDFESNAPHKVKKAVRNTTHEIIPHKAIYKITLDKNYGDDVTDATGEMTINIFDTGDGYVFEQSSTLIVYNGDGEGEQIITHLATWQDYDGNRYRFNSRTLRNGEQEEVIKGEALKDSGSNTAKVTYELPNFSTVDIPADTLFPLHHLINALESAKSGKNVVSNTVFDGSSETHEPVTVDTILGAPKDSNLTVKTHASPAEKHFKNQWPMRLAVYAPGSNNPEPDYEMVQTVLDNAVIKDMTLDYGTFQVKATLDKLDIYTPPERETPLAEAAPVNLQSPTTEQPQPAAPQPNPAT